ncbi:unnamed protein product [Owenia fusiformis]|uniref:Uncharacterized protein n=1 Tax=Owenia fusiformis TaxID=6347 RepID=A0A8S4PJJ0_OWEFU|nr:unnamed protein product [Owenia fusiformis]
MSGRSVLIAYERYQRLLDQSSPKQEEPRITEKQNGAGPISVTPAGENISDRDQERGVPVIEKGARKINLVPPGIPAHKTRKRAAEKFIDTTEAKKNVISSWVSL